MAAAKRWKKGDNLFLYSDMIVRLMEANLRSLAISHASVEITALTWGGGNENLYFISDWHADKNG